MTRAATTARQPDPIEFRRNRVSQSVPGQVPVLSLANMARADFAAAFGGSFQRFGFAMVKDHGMDQALIDRGWALARRFFALPEEVKRRYDEIGRASCRERVGQDV